MEITLTIDWTFYLINNLNNSQNISMKKIKIKKKIFLILKKTVFFSIDKVDYIF